MSWLRRRIAKHFVLQRGFQSTFETLVLLGRLMLRLYLHAGVMTHDQPCLHGQVTLLVFVL